MPLGVSVSTPSGLKPLYGASRGQKRALVQGCRDERLYLADYNSFEDYCREKWGMSRVRAHQLIEATKVVEGLKVLTIVNTLPETESQARPLSLLPAAEQAEAWRPCHEQQERARDLW